jgi:hypothetical protein
VLTHINVLLHAARVWPFAEQQYPDQNNAPGVLIDVQLDPLVELNRRFALVAPPKRIEPSAEQTMPLHDMEVIAFVNCVHVSPESVLR